MACCILLSPSLLSRLNSLSKLYYGIPSPWQDINTAWPSYLRLHGAQLVLSGCCLWRPGPPPVSSGLSCESIAGQSSTRAQLESSGWAVRKLNVTWIAPYKMLLEASNAEHFSLSSKPVFDSTAQPYSQSSMTKKLSCFSVYVIL